ncbi:MAG: HD domain-containing protein [Euryarchaeota archaeon]|nr:HD domain-containing protein [Euryarchaeota archaeon]
MSADELVRAAGMLKRIKRQGWLDAGLPAERVESVADHSFRTAFLVAFVSGPDIDMARALKMALVHDLGESEVGDLTPRSKVPKKKKREMEGRAVAALGNGEVLALWKEFEEGKSPEARAVREVDRYERVIQAMEYVLLGHPERKLRRFWKGVPVKAQGAGRRAQGAGRRAQGAGRKAQGAGLKGHGAGGKGTGHGDGRRRVVP